MRVKKMGLEECKVVFSDGGTVRVLRGRITSEDEHFITLSRRDGEVRLSKNQIVKIDERKVYSAGDASGLY